MVIEYAFSTVTLVAIVTLLAFYRKYSKSKGPKGKESSYAAIWWIVLFFFGLALNILGAIYKKESGVNGFNYWIAFGDALAATFKMFIFDFNSNIVSGLAADNYLYRVAIVITFIATGLWTVSIAISLVFKGVINEVVVFLHAHDQRKKPHYIVIGSGSHFDVFLDNLTEKVSKRDITIITGESEKSDGKVEVLYKKYLSKGYAVIGTRADEDVLDKAGMKNQRRETYIIAMTEDDEQNITVAQIVSKRIFSLLFGKKKKTDAMLLANINSVLSFTPEDGKYTAYESLSEKEKIKFEEDILNVLRKSNAKYEPLKKQIIEILKTIKIEARIMYTFIERAEHFAFAENAYGKVDFFNPYELRVRKFFYENPITDYVADFIDTGKARLKGTLQEDGRITVDEAGKVPYRIKNLFIGFGTSNYHMLKGSVMTGQLLGCDYNAIVYDENVSDSNPSIKQAMLKNQAPGLFGEDALIPGEEYLPSPTEKYNIKFRKKNVLDREFYKAVAEEIKGTKEVKGSDFTAIYIALGDDKLAVETACEIRQTLYEVGHNLANIRLFVKAREESAMIAEELVNNKRGTPLPIECFGLDKDVLTVEQIIGMEMDSLAKSISNQMHDTDWEYLEEFERDSNRRKVLELRAMLGFIGLDIKPNSEWVEDAEQRYRDRYGLSDDRIKEILRHNPKIDKSARLEYLTMHNGRIEDSARNNLARREHLRWDTFHFVSGWTKKPKSLIGGINGNDNLSKYLSWPRSYIDLGRKNTLTKQHACITTLDELVTLRNLQAERGGKKPEEYDTIYHDFTFLDKLIERLKEMNKCVNDKTVSRCSLVCKDNVLVQKIGIITYNAPHLKTAQVIEGLSKKSHSAEAIEYIVFALPYSFRKEREIIFQHRPPSEVGEHTRVIAERYGMEYILCESDKDIKDCEIYILCGAGILSSECVKRNENRILNCHPGIIPKVRGLDAFKWAIYNKQQVGNTLYLISEEVDLAEMGLVSVTPLYKDDTIQTFAARHYSREIDMLVNYDTNMPWQRLIPQSLSEAKKNFNEANHRMSSEQEYQLNERFNDYKYIYAKKNVDNTNEL